MDGIFRPKMHYIAGFCIYSLNFSGGNTPLPSRKRSRCLDSDTNFRLARQRSHCSSFTKRSWDQLSEL